ncbi:MAG: iron-sulfur cluster insertion protein ErpA [Acidobacteriota bacterium]|nr:iron-sulfur cluster insertion protein ErpA [Acidobacteriota bacterium]MDQ7088514.1 iron-sulfur cluster insertion protein ErpA [Acidobacteriota bacterium]
MSATTNEFPVQLTEVAAGKIRTYANGNEEFSGKAFRVFVEGGGCAGFRYAFVFDEPQENDFRGEVHGVKVAVDPLSMNYLRGATVDYVESLSGSGFTVQNPNASSSCGCGHSFQA